MVLPCQGALDHGDNVVGDVNAVQVDHVDLVLLGKRLRDVLCGADSLFDEDLADHLRVAAHQLSERLLDLLDADNAQLDEDLANHPTGHNHTTPARPPRATEEVPCI